MGYEQPKSKWQGPSRIVRRSGFSVCLIADLLRWIPEEIYQVGIGVLSEETVIFLEAWPDVRLIGFEAHPIVFNAMKSRYPGVILNYAIGKEIGKGTLWSPPRHKDGASLYCPDNQEATPFPTQIETIDHLFPKGPNGRTLLWLDCEGSELDVLHGAPNFLKHVEVINVEVTSKPISKKWCDANQVHDFLAAEGFKRQWVHTQRSSAGQVDAIYVRPELFKPEYCCCPCQVER